MKLRKFIILGVVPIMTFIFHVHTGRTFSRTSHLPFFGAIIIELSTNFLNENFTHARITRLMMPLIKLRSLVPGKKRAKPFSSKRFVMKNKKFTRAQATREFLSLFGELSPPKMRVSIFIALIYSDKS